MIDIVLCPHWVIRGICRLPLVMTAITEGHGVGVFAGIAAFVFLLLKLCARMR